MSVPLFFVYCFSLGVRSFPNRLAHWFMPTRVMPLPRWSRWISLSAWKWVLKHRRAVFSNNRRIPNYRYACCFSVCVLWWPLHERKRKTRWRLETEWLMSVQCGALGAHKMHSKRCVRRHRIICRGWMRYSEAYTELNDPVGIVAKNIPAVHSSTHPRPNRW